MDRQPPVTSRPRSPGQSGDEPRREQPEAPWGRLGCGGTRCRMRPGAGGAVDQPPPSPAGSWGQSGVCRSSACPNSNGRWRKDGPGSRHWQRLQPHGVPGDGGGTPARRSPLPRRGKEGGRGSQQSPQQGPSLLGTRVGAGAVESIPGRAALGGCGDFSPRSPWERVPEIAAGAAASRPAPHASCFPPSHASAAARSPHRALYTSAAAHPLGATRLTAQPPGGPDPALTTRRCRICPQLRILSGRGS